MLLKLFILVAFKLLLHLVNQSSGIWQETTRPSPDHDHTSYHHLCSCTKHPLRQKVDLKQQSYFHQPLGPTRKIWQEEKPNTPWRRLCFCSARFFFFFLTHLQFSVEAFKPFNRLSHSSHLGAASSRCCLNVLSDLAFFFSEQKL